MTTFLTAIILALAALILATTWIGGCIWIGGHFSRRSREQRRKAASRFEQMQRDFDERSARVEQRLREKF